MIQKKYDVRVNFLVPPRTM